MDLPVFKYHPDPFRTKAFRKLAEPETCPCCGKPTSVIYEGPFYSAEDVEGLCPACIANGAASEMFDGEFQDSASVDDVGDPSKLEELACRTPGYCGWQQEYWRAHCGDFCAFIDYIGWKELKQLGLADEILEDPGLPAWFREHPSALVNGGSPQGYLFRCLHCGKHLLHIDCD